MKQPNRQISSQRWTRETPRVPATRRGLAPITPAYIPARRNGSQKSGVRSQNGTCG